MLKLYALMTPCDDIRVASADIFLTAEDAINMAILYIDTPMRALDEYEEGSEYIAVDYGDRVGVSKCSFYHKCNDELAAFALRVLSGDPVACGVVREFLKQEKEARDE